METLTTKMTEAEVASLAEELGLEVSEHVVRTAMKDANAKLAWPQTDHQVRVTVSSMRGHKTMWQESANEHELSRVAYHVRKQRFAQEQADLAELTLAAYLAGRDRITGVAR